MGRRRGGGGRRSGGQGGRPSPEQVRQALQGGRGGGNAVDLSKGMVINPEAAKFQNVQMYATQLSKYVGPVIQCFLESKGRAPTEEEIVQICKDTSLLVETVNAEFDILIKDKLEQWDKEHGGEGEDGDTVAQPKLVIPPA